MATIAIRQEEILDRPKQKKSLGEKIRDVLDTVAFELSPYFGPLFTNHPDLKYMDSNSIREKTLGDGELRNK